MKWSHLLLIITVLVILALLIERRTRIKSKQDSNINTVNKLDRKEFNNCLVMLLDMYNELTEIVKASINSDNRFNIAEKVLIIKDVENGDIDIIKKRLRSFHLEGKFNDVIDKYLLQDSDMDAIVNGILNLSKSSSNIPNHILVKLEYKEMTIISFLQSEIDKKINSDLFLLNSVKDFEQFLLELIIISKTKLETMALSLMV